MQESKKCRIASVTSCLSENEAEKLQNDDAQIPYFDMDISTTFSRIEDGDGSYFLAFLRSLTRAYLFSDWGFPLNSTKLGCSSIEWIKLQLSYS